MVLGLCDPCKQFCCCSPNISFYSIARLVERTGVNIRDNLVQIIRACFLGFLLINITFPYVNHFGVLLNSCGFLGMCLNGDKLVKEGILT